MNENKDTTIVTCPICNGWILLTGTEDLDNVGMLEIGEAVKAGFNVIHKTGEEARQFPACTRDHNKAKRTRRVRVTKTPAGSNIDPLTGCTQVPAIGAPVETVLASDLADALNDTPAVEKNKFGTVSVKSSDLISALNIAKAICYYPNNGTTMASATAMHTGDILFIISYGTLTVQYKTYLDAVFSHKIRLLEKDSRLDTWAMYHSDQIKTLDIDKHGVCVLDISEKGLMLIPDKGTKQLHLQVRIPEMYEDGRVSMFVTPTYHPGIYSNIRFGSLERLTKQLKSVAYAISTDQTKRQLMFINGQKTDSWETIELCCTDGHRIATRVIDCAYDTDVPLDKLSIPIEVVEVFEKILKESPKEDCMVSIHANKGFFVVKAGDLTCEYTNTRPYPPYKAVLPVISECKTSSCDTKQLLTILKACRKSIPKKNPENAVLIENKGDGYYYISPMEENSLFKASIATDDTLVYKHYLNLQYLIEQLSNQLDDARILFKDQGRCYGFGVYTPTSLSYQMPVRISE